MIQAHRHERAVLHPVGFRGTRAQTWSEECKTFLLCMLTANNKFHPRLALQSVRRQDEQYTSWGSLVDGLSSKAASLPLSGTTFLTNWVLPSRFVVLSMPGFKETAERVFFGNRERHDEVYQ